MLLGRFFWNMAAAQLFPSPPPLKYIEQAAEYL